MADTSYTHGPIRYPANADAGADSAGTVRHLYVHIPFCHHICPYCSFYKHTPGALANRAFVDALLGELRQRMTSIPLRPRTIYFGGGTPTLLSTALLERLLGGMADLVDLSDVEEWTLEANPATFDLAKAERLKQLGVTRVSLGVQSWIPATLAQLGRDHSPEEAATAFHTLREAEIGTVNVDLMFSVPGERLDEWRQTLERTVELEPDHISAYNLNYEEDTPFFERLESGEFHLDSDADATFFHAATEQLEGAGFHHYEISNYARPGRESIHNRAYWNGADYLGIGPSAVSTVSGRRWTSHADTAGWIAELGSSSLLETDVETLTPDQRRTEAIGLQLRTSEGLHRRWLSGGDEVADRQRLAPLLEEKLVRWNGDRLVLTDTGKPLVDAIATHLL